MDDVEQQIWACAPLCTLSGWTEAGSARSCGGLQCGVEEAWLKIRTVWHLIVRKYNIQLQSVVFRITITRKYIPGCGEGSSKCLLHVQIKLWPCNIELDLVPLATLCLVMQEYGGTGVTEQMGHNQSMSCLYSWHKVKHVFSGGFHSPRLHSSFLKSSYNILYQAC